METKLKLDDIQDTMEDLIKFFSENFADHVKCGLLLSSLRNAADDIHHIRFDQAVSGNFKQKEDLKKEVQNVKS